MEVWLRGNSAKFPIKRVHGANPVKGYKKEKTVAAKFRFPILLKMRKKFALTTTFGICITMNLRMRNDRNKEFLNLRTIYLIY